QDASRFKMEEGYELDLTYITERIIAVSFPRGCSEEIYSHNLKDVTRMLRSKHADNYLIINLSEKRHDLTKMNPKTLDTGWPDMHAPPLDKICTICKAMEGWLNADPLHVVVIHCRGGKGRIGVVISSFVNFTEVSASADQALDRFAMRKYHDDKVSALMTPSQKRYVWILNSLLSGSMKINASPLFLHCLILHGIPNFDAAGVCHPYIKVYQGMQAVYSSGIYHIGPGHRDRVCITLEPAQLLKGDIMIKCYHKGDVASVREVVFRLQFHTGAVQGYNLMFEKEDMESANKDSRFPDYGKVELVFSEGPERIPGADRWQNGPDVIVDYNTADPLIRWDSYQNMRLFGHMPGVRGASEAPRSQGLTQDKVSSKQSPSGGEGTLGRGACTTSATSSPDHSDHALSVSSDSGLSSTSLWADKPASVVASTITTGTIKHNQGPSQQEKVELKRLLSGFGLEGPSAEDMDDQGPRVGIQQIVPAQVHINGEPRPRERETDILDDEITVAHDLRSVDSLGTLSSSCHKSSQNSLLSDGFGSPGGEEHQGQSQHCTAPPAVEEYERAYADARRGCLTSRSNSVASANPSSASIGKQHVYRQGSYSTQSWVRQQQMVAAQQFIYMPENENEAEVYRGNKQGSSVSKASQPSQPTGTTTDTTKEALRNKVPHKDEATQQRDEEFKSLTLDIDNSIDQLNQLIMDLDPTFVPLSGLSSSIKRNGVSGSAPKCSNGINLKFEDKNTGALKNTQQTDLPASDSRISPVHKKGRPPLIDFFKRRFFWAFTYRKKTLKKNPNTPATYLLRAKVFLSTRLSVPSAFQQTYSAQTFYISKLYAPKRTFMDSWFFREALVIRVCKPARSHGFSGRRHLSLQRYLQNPGNLPRHRAHWVGWNHHSRGEIFWLLYEQALSRIEANCIPPADLFILGIFLKPPTRPRRSSAVLYKGSAGSTDSSLSESPRKRGHGPSVLPQLGLGWAGGVHEPADVLAPPASDSGTHSMCVWDLCVFFVLLLMRHPLYRSTSAEYRPRVPEMDSGVEVGSDTTPPTPAFPISPPTPYGRFVSLKNISELSQFRQTPSPSLQSCGGYRTDHGSKTKYLPLVEHTNNSHSYFASVSAVRPFYAFIPRSVFIKADYRARQIVARLSYTFTYSPALLCSPSDIGGHCILSPGLLWVRKRDAQNFPSLPPLNHVGVDGSPETSVNCHRTLSSTQSASAVGPFQRTESPPWPEHPSLSCQASLGTYSSTRQPLHHSLSLDYSCCSPPLNHSHVHPAPNAHSSPRSGQRSRMACYALSRSPAQSFAEQEDSNLGYSTDCPNSTTSLLGNGSMDRDLLDGQNPSLLLPPHLPEKKRASDGEHSFRTASPSLSGFSSPHSGSSLSIPFPNVLPDLSSQMSGTASPLPDVLASKQVTAKFVQDTSKFWYKPDISRDQAISVLKDKEPGCFIIRDSHSFRGAYGLAMKVATPPPSVLQQSKKADLSNELVRHFLIECTQKGVRLKGCPNEPYFGSLTALVCQHSITPLALPCKLILPDRGLCFPLKDPLEDVVEATSQSVTNSAAELLKQGAACNVWYLSSVEMESLTGVQAVQKATSMTLSSNPPPMSTVVHFKVSSQGITLTDNQRKLFFRRHYHVNTVIYCALDPQDRKWKRDGYPSARIFGFVARKTGNSTDNVCHLFAEHDPEQPASAIVNFVSKVMIGSQKSK
uniref:Tensin 3 n=1 Tax=Tetraodon nigroviridis TaxID=99883 RepID=H3BZQ3_TETNG